MLRKAKSAECKRMKYCRCKKSMASCVRGCACVRANVKCVIASLCTGTPINVQRLNSHSKTSIATERNTHFQCRTWAIICTIDMINIGFPDKRMTPDRCPMDGSPQTDAPLGHLPSRTNSSLPCSTCFSLICTRNFLSQTAVKRELFVIHAIYRPPTSIQLK